MSSNTITGARAIFIVNGNKVAYTNSLNYNISQNLTPIDVLDQLVPAEFAETGYAVDCQCSSFRVYNSSPMQLGIQARLEDLLNQGELTIEVHDRQNPGAPALLIERCKMSGRSGSFDARGVWQEQWSFVGIKFSDETGA